MIARSATTSTSGNGTAHEIGPFDDMMNAVFKSSPDKKRDATILSVGPLTHQNIREKKKYLHPIVFVVTVNFHSYIPDGQ
jgi:hypothetical protein